LEGISYESACRGPEASLGAFVCSGCDRERRTGFLAPRTRVADISRLVVVAVEPPPLLVTDAVASSDSASIFLTAAPVAVISPVGGAALVLVGTILMLMERAAADLPRIEPAKLEELLTKGLVWSPTRALAEEATAQLRSTANSRTVTTSRTYRVLPVENRDRTWHMENWLRPIRAWYAEETAGTGLQVEIGTDTLLEVSLLNYEWHTHRFVVQVMMRLVDVRPGRVIGRTRDWAYPEVGRAAELLAKDGAVLKTVFIKTTRPLGTRVRDHASAISSATRSHSSLSASVGVRA
jgi:hypothetical protein